MNQTTSTTEVKCPNCGEIFQVDETGYNRIVNQIRDKEFKKELDRREKEILAAHQKDLDVIRAQQEKAVAEVLSKRDATLADKEQQIVELKGKLEANDAATRLAVTEAVSKAIEEKAREFKQAEEAHAEALVKKGEVLAARDREIVELKAKIANGETERNLAVSRAIEQKNTELAGKASEIVKLEGELKLRKSEEENRTQTLKSQYELQLKMKDEEIEQYKNFKAKQSTKMVGESLEQYCSDQFNMIRPVAFPKADFGKDNNAKSGSKGDFIYRDWDDDGTELISIMFEMKNECDTTATKQKNEHFFKELDKDRKEKGCEYAVLVSLLEADSDFYNQGIVDVSYKYPKMFVVRPQNFIALIGLLRNAAKNALQVRRELEAVRSQQTDIQKFEENLNVFKTAFGTHYHHAGERFHDAMEGIDKMIDGLNKIKENLRLTQKHLGYANNKAEDLTIRKLTKDSPSLRQMFKDAKANSKIAPAAASDDILDVIPESPHEDSLAEQDADIED